MFVLTQTHKAIERTGIPDNPTTNCIFVAVLFAIALVSVILLVLVLTEDWRENRTQNQNRK